MRTYVFEGRMTALSSITHNGGQSFGVTSKLRREKIVQPDGSIEDVPMISGNGLRGMLRDRGMLHMCRQLGYGVNEQTGEVLGLTLPAFYFLFSGGALTSGGSKGLDIDQARSIKSLIPLVGIFGGAVGNMIMPGKLKMGKAIPICAETQYILPAAFRSERMPSVWDYLQEEMYTRKDDEKDEHKRRLITSSVRGLLDDERRIKAAKRGTSDEVADAPGTAQQMRYYVETLAAGTPMYWKIVLDDVTDIEFEAFVTALVEFSRMPYIGGKSNVGLGEVSIEFDGWISIDSRAQISAMHTEDLARPSGAQYLAHLRDRGDAIRSLLGAMQ